MQRRKQIIREIILAITNDSKINKISVRVSSLDTTAWSEGDFVGNTRVLNLIDSMKFVSMIERIVGEKWRWLDGRVETSLEPSSRISRIEARLTELDLWTIILEVLTSLLSFLRRRKASMTLSLSVFVSELNMIRWNLGWRRNPIRRSIFK